MSYLRAFGRQGLQIVMVGLVFFVHVVWFARRLREIDVLAAELRQKQKGPRHR